MSHMRNPLFLEKGLFSEILADLIYQLQKDIMPHKEAREIKSEDELNELLVGFVNNKELTREQWVIALGIYGQTAYETEQNSKKPEQNPEQNTYTINASRILDYFILQVPQLLNQEFADSWTDTTGYFNVNSKWKKSSFAADYLDSEGQLPKITSKKLYEKMKLLGKFLNNISNLINEPDPKKRLNPPDINIPFFGNPKTKIITLIRERLNFISKQIQAYENPQDQGEEKQREATRQKEKREEAKIRHLLYGFEPTANQQPPARAEEKVVAPPPPPPFVPKGVDDFNKAITNSLNEIKDDDELTALATHITTFQTEMLAEMNGNKDKNTFDKIVLKFQTNATQAVDLAKGDKAWLYALISGVVAAAVTLIGFVVGVVLTGTPAGAVAGYALGSAAGAGVASAVVAGLFGSHQHGKNIALANQVKEAGDAFVAANLPAPGAVG